MSADTPRLQRLIGGEQLAGEPLAPFREAKAEAVERFTRAYAAALHAQSDGKTARAAEIAGVDVSYVRRWFRMYGSGD